MSRTTLVRALPLVLAVPLAAGCGGGSAAVDTVTPAATAAPSTAAAASASASATPSAGTDLVSGSPQPSVEKAFLTDVRVARHDGGDRVVFQFQGGLPGYTVHYVTAPITQDGSGKVLHVDGNAFLEVRMEPAAGGKVTPDGFKPTYSGPATLPGDGAQVAQLQRTGDFEGVLTWVVGVSRTAPFRVSTLTDPSRLVIDITGS